MKRPYLFSILAAMGGLVLFHQAPVVRAADPGLKIVTQSTNQVKLTVTNAVVGVSYEIYRTPVLDDPAYPWTLHLIGTLNVTNFTAQTDVGTIGFFKATEGRDWDGDGILNEQDGQPSNAGAGRLTITIDSPTAGQVIQ